MSGYRSHRIGYRAEESSGRAPWSEHTCVCSSTFTLSDSHQSYSLRQFRASSIVNISFVSFIEIVGRQLRRLYIADPTDLNISGRRKKRSNVRTCVGLRTQSQTLYPWTASQSVEKPSLRGKPRVSGYWQAAKEADLSSSVRPWTAVEN